MSTNNITLLRLPTLDDGPAAHQLIQQCPPLDTNSAYCNLLQCDHFADTSVAAEHSKALVGFISGYRIPSRPDTLFIWQVAVAASARGTGLATRMLEEILSRPQTKGVRYIETSITADNDASWALFKKFAGALCCTLSAGDWMDREQHFNDQHASEQLVRIGPFTYQGD